MKRLWILLVLVLVVSGCKNETPVKPSDNTQTQNNSPAIPIVGDTIGIKLDSCVKVLDTLTMDTLTICWDSVMDRRALYPDCEYNDFWGFYLASYYTLNNKIHFVFGIEDCNIYARGCGGRIPDPLPNGLPTSIDTLGYEICFIYLIPIQDTFPQPGIPDSAYFSKLYIHKK